MATPLFMDGDTSNPAYRNIRDAKDGRLRTARSHCEYRWIFFQHHVDPEFRNELRSNFNARYWEMYLTTSIILAGYAPRPPGMAEKFPRLKPGLKWIFILGPFWVSLKIDAVSGC